MPQAKNAFYFYMIEYRNKEAAKGTVFKNGLKEVAEAASPSWAVMPPQQRKKYEHQAALCKQQTNVPEKKYTSTGESLAEVERRNKEKLRKEQAERDDVASMTKLCNDVMEERFHLMSTNYYCRITNECFKPCEVALVTFSVAQGITNTYHALVDPGQLPVGFASEVKERFEATGMEAPPVPGSVSDFQLMLSHILARVKRDNESRPRPIFCMPDNHDLDATRSFLEQCCDIAEYDPDEFRVYNYGLLTYNLMIALASTEQDSLMSEQHALIELRKDRHEAAMGIACEHHESQDKAKLCSLSRAKRFAYYLLDLACSRTGVEPVPGKHVPPQTDLEEANSFRMRMLKEEIAKTAVPPSARKWADHTGAAYSQFQSVSENPTEWPSLGGSIASASTASSAKQRNKKTVRMPHSHPRVLTSSITSSDGNTAAIKIRMGDKSSEVSKK